MNRSSQGEFARLQILQSVNECWHQVNCGAKEMAAHPGIWVTLASKEQEGVVDQNTKVWVMSSEFLCARVLGEGNRTSDYGVLLKHLGKVLMFAGLLEKSCLWKSVQTDRNRDLRSSHGVESTFLYSKLSFSWGTALSESLRGLSLSLSLEESILHSHCLGRTEWVAVFLKSKFSSISTK